MNIRKYAYITFYAIKQRITYRTNIFLKLFSSGLFVIIIYYMWTAILVDNKTKMLETVSYMVAINVMYQFISINLEIDIGNVIVNGDICIELLKPIPFMANKFFNKLGDLFVNIIVILLPLVLLSAYILKSGYTHLNISILFFISILLSFVLIFLFEFMIGLVGFYTSQIFGVSLLKSTLIGLMAGITVPLQFYPDAVGNVLNNMPFQAMYCIPVEIYNNNQNVMNIVQIFLYNAGIEKLAIRGILEQIIWCIIFTFCALILWKKARKVITIQGG